MTALLDYFHEAVATKEGVDNLKKLILQLAVQGKLVEQDSNDEPASELLKKVELERKRLIKEKKVKKTNSLSPVLEEEIPYPLPQGWKWVRLGELGITQTGTTPKKNSGDFFDGDIPFIKPADILKDTIRYDNESLTELGLENGRSIPANSILMVCIGTIGKCYFTDRLVSCNQQINALTPIISDVKYLYFSMTSEVFQSQCINNASSTTLRILNKSKWENLLLPLPPLNEQIRIKAKIETLFNLCNKLTSQIVKKQTKSDILNKNIFTKLEDPNNISQMKDLQFVITNIEHLCNDKVSIDQFRNSLLGLAIQGKLVEQDPTDEPASVLLEKIKVEKEQFVRDKKVKKSKSLSNIPEEEIPYKLPEGWKWVRLGEICNVITDGDHQPPPQAATGIHFLVISNVSTGTLSFKNTRFVPNEYYNELPEFKKPNKGDILFTVTGSYGIPIIIDTNKEFCFQRHIALLRPSSNIMTEYLYWGLLSNLVKKQCDENATGIAQKTVSLTTLRNIKFALPPLNEQKRIVDKVNQLMILCDELEKYIQESKQESERLLKAILQEAFVVKEEALN